MQTKSINSIIGHWRVEPKDDTHTAHIVFSDDHPGVTYEYQSQGWAECLVRALHAGHTKYRAGSLIGYIHTGLTNSVNVRSGPGPYIVLPIEITWVQAFMWYLLGADGVVIDKQGRVTKVKQKINSLKASIHAFLWGVKA